MQFSRTFCSADQGQRCLSQDSRSVLNKQADVVGRDREVEHGYLETPLRSVNAYQRREREDRGAIGFYFSFISNHRLN